ncbi:MAG: PIG-L family deacetylase [Pseudomonadota bacterium]
MPGPGTLLTIMAHPDDAEFAAGGLLSLWHKAGGDIHIMCLTDGSAGHHYLSRRELAKRRAQEAKNAAAIIGASVTIASGIDGALTASLEVRAEVIRKIREIGPDLIVTHRSCDYHPDHRATAQLVQDACFLLQVPAVEPETPPLRHVPPVLQAWDRFKTPQPHRPDWVIDTTSTISQIMNLLVCRKSQVFEWLPFLDGRTPPEDIDSTEAVEWLKAWYVKRPKTIAHQAAPAFTYAEAYEVSEYGGRFVQPEF